MRTLPKASAATALLLVLTACDAYTKSKIEREFDEKVTAHKAHFEPLMKAKEQECEDLKRSGETSEADVDRAALCQSEFNKINIEYLDEYIALVKERDRRLQISGVKGQD